MQSRNYMMRMKLKMLGSKNSEVPTFEIILIHVNERMNK